jgi:hypothetical protein
MYVVKAAETTFVQKIVRKNVGEIDYSITIGVGNRYSNDISSQNIKTIFHIVKWSSFLVK